MFFETPRYSSFEKTFTAHYRPLVVSSYALNYAAGGLNPTGYHLVNLAFHAGSAFLVFLIVKAMLRTCTPQVLSLRDPLHSKTQWVPRRSNLSAGIASSASPPRNDSNFPALAAGLIFAVHPFNSEVVNYMTARSSVMCAFFYLLAFWCWIQYRGSEKGEQPRLYYAASLLSFLLALLSKEVAITLPAVLWLYDLYAGRIRIDFRTHLPHLPFILLLAVPYLLLRKMFYGAMILREFSRDPGDHLITQIEVLARYFQLLFVPLGLTIDHDVSSSRSPADPIVILSLFLLIGILATGFWLFRRSGEWHPVSYFILWFFITILPTTLLPLNAVLQENRGYLPGVGFAVFLGILLHRTARWDGRIPLFLLILLVTIYSVTTFQRNRVWENDVTLWTDAVRKAPASPRAHDNLGLAYFNAGLPAESERAFLETLRLNPRHYYAYYNLGVLYQTQNRLEEAARIYRRGLSIHPLFFRAHYNLGIVLKTLGRFDEAIEIYRKAIEIDSRHPFVFNNLGVLYLQKKDYPGAEGAFRSAIEKDPNYVKAYYNLGNVYFDLGRYREAETMYREAVRIQPRFENARIALERVAEKLRESPVPPFIEKDKKEPGRRHHSEKQEGFLDRGRLEHQGGPPNDGEEG
ncbi:MAG: tetratricopeptide repeat protein, partial [Nitrospirae bacterium]|nr:tetratricopeptide repeat protein [Nitrospirota bacterium]